jgi:hypothetical protein
MKTIETAFRDGMKSGEFPNFENTAKAMKAMASYEISALCRAYWSGYLCQLFTETGLPMHLTPAA